MQTTTNVILALDVGEKRIGVARANTLARLASPLTTIRHTPAVIDDIQKLIAAEGATTLVLGLPRGLDGQETAQTARIQAFGNELQTRLGLPLHWQDEAVTSRKAEAELEARGKPYQKGDIDALSATYILEDFLHDHLEDAA
jgi:putative Holliday junction resolvase